MPKTARVDTTPARNVSTSRSKKRFALNSPPAPSPPAAAATVDEVRSIGQDLFKQEFDSMYKRINDSFSKNLNEKLAPIKEEMEQITTSMSFMSARFDSIEAEHKAASDTVKELVADNIKLNNTVTHLTQRLSYLEQQSRANNLEIQCVPESKSENLMNIISQLGHVVKCKLNEEVIANCTRVAKVNPSTARPRSIVVQFVSPKTRDQVLAATYKFNKDNPNDKLCTAHLGFGGDKMPVFVVEHLSPHNKALHAAVRLRAKEKCYKYVWVRSGKIFARKNDDSGYILIKEFNDLSKIV
ncbi:uncharacterized protein LOC114360541 [Ostrinia furnacalis]|uniref:uncharacterized protein LOC114360541 n=1 Tax=Ostrinia furnacalis TaxID=93504 RepID=UPI00103F8ABF|nr:uncharacterized protein LOC114360541 [Ostrinia furnacalis]